MNATSICARWRAEAWDCNVADSLIDPAYFHPPTPPNGGPILRVTAFHATYPEGRVFSRESGLHEGRWTRLT